MHRLSSETVESLIRALAPIETAQGLPNFTYADPDFTLFERDEVLSRTWVCIGVGNDVPNPQDVRPVELMGMPLLMVRDRRGTIRVFHNVCSHRGMRLVSGSRSGAPVITCPYHAWAYGLDGSLRATPFIGGPGTAECPGFERGKHGLKPVRSAVWCDAVFVNLDGQAPAIEDHVAPIAQRWSHLDPSLLRHGGLDSRFDLDLACNWKLAVENFCEGYHLPWIHPGLNSYSRLEDHYNIAEEGAYAGQGSLAYRPQLSTEGLAFPELPDLPQSWHGKGEYLALFPNILLGLHADHLFMVVLEPIGPSRTRERMEIYYFGDEALDSGHRSLRTANSKLWQGIFEEDRFVVEGMQAGRASPGFQGGAFSPAMDGPTHCFHKWLARAATTEATREAMRAIA